MADNISYIHSNKLAKYNYKYLGKDGTVYVGQKDGRLKKLIGSGTDNTATTTNQNLDVSLSWGNITGNILNQTDLINYISTVIGAITLDGLADVVITAPLAGDVLTYDAINNIWVNLPGGGGGATVVGRTGDVIANLSGGTYTISTVVSPFLLMGG